VSREWGGATLCRRQRQGGRRDRRRIRRLQRRLALLERKDPIFIGFSARQTDAAFPTDAGVRMIPRPAAYAVRSRPPTVLGRTPAESTFNPLPVSDFVPFWRRLCGDPCRILQLRIVSAVREGTFKSWGGHRSSGVRLRRIAAYRVGLEMGDGSDR
jgi:hypothetical protein